MTSNLNADIVVLLELSLQILIIGGEIFIIRLHTLQMTFLKVAKHGKQQPK